MNPVLMRKARRTARLRPAACLLAAAAVAVLAAACGGGSSSSAGAGPSASATSTTLEKTTVTVGTVPVIDAAPFEIALKDGYFAQQGLTVKDVPVLQSTQAVPDLLRGTVDIIGAGNYTSYIEGDSRGAFTIDVVGMASDCVPKDMEVLTLPGSGITSAKDLAGKTVAVNLTGNIQTLTLNAILKADGVTGQPDYVAIPFPEMGAALKAHRVDAISAVEPYITADEKADGAIPVTSQCVAPVANYPVSGYFTTASWVQRYPNTLRAFQRAMARAQAYADANPAAVRAILPTFTKITPAQARQVALGTFPATIDVARLQQMADLMLQQGMISSRFQVSAIVAP
jgi:NitT/TauT family transport system substrate-binding protein